MSEVSPMDMETYLTQGVKWINRDGSPMKITDMSPLWRRNAARWLVRNAGVLWQAYELSRFRNQLVNLDDTEWRAEDLVASLAAISKPDEWIQTTALYRALTARDTPESAHVMVMPSSPGRRSGQTEIEALIPREPNEVYRHAATR